MSAGRVVLVAAIYLVAGTVNAIAGGGSILSFPTLIALGLDPVSANVSNTLALWPGYFSSAASLRSRLAETDTSLRPLAVSAGVGAVLGTVLLLAGPEDAFEAIVPFLVLVAVGMLALPSAWLDRLRAQPHAGGRVAAQAGVFLAGVYGAYFGGALGIVLLAVLNAFSGSSLRGLNAVKVVLSLLINSIALVAFVGFGPVTWTVVGAGAPAAFVGGLVGARLTDHINPVVLRWVVVVLGFGAGIALLVR